ncbi:hypothetical protein [Helicobacter cetorum]|nr:hypothetical protein [Helicobacter cetorum]
MLKKLNVSPAVNDLLDYFKHPKNNESKDPIKELEWLYLTFLNQKEKMIELQVYEVLLSDEIKNPSYFNSYHNTIESIKDSFEKGKIESINKRLSKTILRETFIDRLLNNWGIHHLHLGNDSNNNFSL